MKQVDKKTEEDLLRRLVLTTFMIFALGGLLFVSARYFGPKIGALFGLISVNRENPEDEDTIPPIVPSFSSIPPAINKKEIIINGITEPGATVKLFVNGPEQQSTVADVDGLFTFANISLIEGKNTIYAKSIDQSGNESENTGIINVIVDTEKPDIEIETPKNGDTIKNLNNRVEVKGKVSEKATVKINNRLAVVKADGTFQLLLGVDEGDVEVVIEATDSAGNTKKESIFIKYEKKS